MNQNLLNKANQDWETFVEGLTDDEKKGLTEWAEPIGSNNLHHLASAGDTVRFDQTVNRLSNRYLYDQEIIPTVYNYYVERGLHEMAFTYITKAQSFLLDDEAILTDNVKVIIESSQDEHVLKSIKQSLSNLRSIKPENLPKVTPENVNDKRVLSEFILHEFIDAAKILLEKSESIKHIPHEDRLNDLFVAILRLRFQIWDWSIHDQARSGHSPNGKGAGETDLLVQCANNTIALAEAFILTGRDASLTHGHLLKAFLYNNFLERYYMIVYYKGPVVNFDRTWESYKHDTESCAYTPKYTFNTDKNFEDLQPKFTNVNALKIAKSMHGLAEMFHIMIDLSH